MSKIAHSILFSFLVVFALAQPTEDTDAFFKSAHHELVPMENGINTNGPDIAHFRFATKLYYSKPIMLPLGRLDARRLHTALASGKSIPFSIQPNSDNLDMAFSSMNVKGDRIYYALTGKDGVAGKELGQIWYRDKNFNGKWGPPVRLPKDIHLNPELVTHPAAGILSESRMDVLFFVGELYKGKGGTDIWMCEVRKDGTFSQPMLMPFNSKADEVAPFFDVYNQTLYFSSNGYDSFGGYDVFRTRYEGDGNWSHPENLGRPINSFYDDLHFSFNEAGHHCYFSSSRPNPTCPNGVPGCRNLDIYRVQLKATLQAYLFDEENNGLLDGCNVELEEVATGKIVRTYLNLEANFASMGLEEGKKYNLIFSKNGYFPLSVQVSAEGKDFFRPYVEEFHLRPMYSNSKPIAFTKNVPPSYNRETILSAKVGGENPLPEKVSFKETHAVPPPPIETASVTVQTNIEEEAVKTEPTTKPLVRPVNVVEKKTNPPAPAPVTTTQPVPAAPTKEELIQKSTTAAKLLSRAAIEKRKKMEAQEKTVREAAAMEERKKLEEQERAAREAAAMEERRNLEEQERAAREAAAIIKKEIETTPAPPITEKATPSNTSPTIKKEEPVTIKEPIKSAPTTADKEAQFLDTVKDQFLQTGNAQITPITDLPMSAINQQAEPVDLLFYHQALQCFVVFDWAKKDTPTSSASAMGDYLSFISTYKGQGQQPSIGITLFDGQGAGKVVYTFLESGEGTAQPAYYEAFALPAYYGGMLPGEGELMGLLKR